MRREGESLLANLSHRSWIHPLCDLELPKSGVVDRLTQDAHRFLRRVEAH
jgi:hypothetical protein